MHGQQTNPLHAIKARSTTMRSALINARIKSDDTRVVEHAITEGYRRGAGVRPLALKAGGK